MPAEARGAPAERGTSTVEFAMVLPLVLIMTLAVLQVGLLLVDRLLVVEAARGGAREAAVNGDDGAVREAALRASGIPGARTEVEVEREGDAGGPVTVRVRYAAPIVVPLVAWLFPDTVELSEQATMRQETSA